MTAQGGSWRGYVTACAGVPLLGGVRHHESSRFTTREAAAQWVSVIVRTNCEASRPPAAWGETWDHRDPDVDTCPVCSLPCHATEGTEDGVHLNCLGCLHEDTYDTEVDRGVTVRICMACSQPVGGAQ